MSIFVYPVSQTHMACIDYIVTVEGNPVQLDTARESIMPYNRRWPGYQRSIEQTGLHNFLSMSTDRPVHFTVKPLAPFDPEEVVIRPRSLGITPTIENGVISFTLPHAAYFTVEVWGRRKALHISPTRSVTTYRRAPTCTLVPASTTWALSK